MNMNKRRRVPSSYPLIALSLTAVLLFFLSSMPRGHWVSADNGPALEQPANVQQVPAVGVRRRPSVKLTGWISETNSTGWQVGKHVLHSSLPASDIKTGMYVVARANVDDQDRLHAVAISVQPLASPLGCAIEFRGIIQEIDDRYWVIGDHLVFATQSTFIWGEPQIGVLAEVKGIHLFNDIVLARSIKVTVPGAYAEVEFEGDIQSMSDDAWAVSGVTVTIGSNTVIQGVPALGLRAEVKGILQPDGSVLAQQVTVKTVSLQVDLEGLVEHIEPAYWVIGKTVVLIDSSTFIDDSRAPAEEGMWAQVRALRRRDGTLLALRIRLLRPN